MRRRELLALGLTAAGLGRLPLKAQGLGDTAGAARDLVYQALELMSTKATPAEVMSAVRFLRSALDQEPSFGDAHYYRNLCLKRLNQDPATQRLDFDAAERYESEALRDKRDPFVLAVPKIYESLPTVGEKWALVIGISQFQPKIGAERLQFAANDAEALAELLRDPDVGRFASQKVFLLTNAEATTANIKARLNTISRNAKPEDVVVIYVSTHGSSRADDLKQVSYLYTYDTDVTSRDQMFGTALPMVEVSGIVSTRCVAQRTIVMFDTCHSGSGVNARALTAEDMDRLRQGAGRYIITSCGPDQLSYEDAGHGFFTASLIAQLKDRKGCVRLKDLFANVQKDVSGKVLQRFNKAQQPMMASSDNSAEIVLGASVGGASDGCVVG